jgi:hypothetical protein
MTRDDERAVGLNKSIVLCQTALWWACVHFVWQLTPCVPASYTLCSQQLVGVLFTVCEYILRVKYLHI